MKILNKAVQFFSRKNKMQFEELSDWILAILGIVSFLVAGYWGLMLGDVVPGFVKAVNETGISMVALGLALLLGGFGITVWFFGCIAARCHSLLYERLFK
jgi:uncharacterized membrane protein